MAGGITGQIPGRRVARLDTGVAAAVRMAAIRSGGGWVVRRAGGRAVRDSGRHAVPRLAGCAAIGRAGRGPMRQAGVGSMGAVRPGGRRRPRGGIAVHHPAVGQVGPLRRMRMHGQGRAAHDGQQALRQHTPAVILGRGGFRHQAQHGGHAGQQGTVRPDQLELQGVGLEDRLARHRPASGGPTHPHRPLVLFVLAIIADLSRPEGAGRRGARARVGVIEKSRARGADHPDAPGRAVQRPPAPGQGGIPLPDLGMQHAQGVLESPRQRRGLRVAGGRCAAGLDQGVAEGLSQEQPVGGFYGARPQ